MSVGIFSSAYLAPVSYLLTMENMQESIIDLGEHYIKQSYRNRAEIVGAHGRENLLVPIQHAESSKQAMGQVWCAEGRWKEQHWNALCSAYGKSPYFQYYKHHFEAIYSLNFPIKLHEWNAKFLALFIQLMKLRIDINYSLNYIEIQANQLDYRNVFHPKKALVKTPLKPYYQCFSNQHGFIENVSAIDILFNIGPNWRNYIVF